MNLFDIRKVCFDWDDSLDGKRVFVADDLKSLRDYVNGHKGDYHRVIHKNQSISSSEVSSRPFRDEEHKSSWMYCYYDPLYEYKWAYAQGKEVQWLDDDGEWRNCTESCLWHDDYEYRIVEEDKRLTKRLTKRQLSQWLAQGNGEFMFVGYHITKGISFVYRPDEENATVTNEVLVRKWSDTEWHEPTVDYCFGEERCQEE